MIKDSLTEQEKRENTIYKMVIDMYGYLYKSLPSYDEVVNDIRSGRYSDLARLYDAGYRKEKEVREEIFSRIYDEIHENFRKDSNITGQELLEFIQRIDFQLFKEIEE